VLATHDHVRWDIGLLFVGGGHERSDARLGALWRRSRGGGFCKIDENCFCGVALWVRYAF
jgi:hypothetical protein